MDTFMGKPFSYWIELDADLREKGLDGMVLEIAELRGKISYYESRIKQMSDFMAVNLEIKQ